MRKQFIFLICAASLCCAQLLPGVNTAKVNSASENAPADSLKALKVKAPVNYDMLIYNGDDSRDYSRSTNASNIEPVRRKRTTGSDIAIGTLKFVGASVGALVGAATVGAIIGTEPNVVYGSSGGTGALEEAVNDAVSAGAYVGGMIGNAATEKFFTDGKEDALRERSMK